MRITVLGYGGWISSPWLGYTSLYVETDVKMVLDAGEGTYARMAQCGLPLPDAVFVSHAHGDHILGVPTLLLMARQRGIKLKVIGLASALSSIEKILDAVSMSHLRQHMEPVPIEARGELRLGSTSLKFAPARHSVEAVHIRIEHGGRCLAYSGDTAPNAELEELARGCDVLAHEVSANPGQEAVANAVGHSTTRDAVELAKRAGVKALLPIHFYLFPPSIPPGIDVYVPYTCASIEL